MKSFFSFFVALLAFASTTLAQVYSITPSSWSGLSNGSNYTAANLGVTAISGTSLDGGVSNRATFRDWTTGFAGAEPTGGQYAKRGASPGFIALNNNQVVTLMPTTEGGVFGGTTGSYTGYATYSADVMFRCSDPASLTQTNDSQIGEMCIGASNAFRVRFFLVNRTTDGYKQRCGIKMYANPTSGATVNQRITGEALAATLEPDMEFNKVYTVTLQVVAGTGTNGLWRIWLDKSLHSNYQGYNTNGGATNLGALGNTFVFTSYAATGYTSGPKIEVCLLPRVRIENADTWYDSLGQPTTASNTGTTRVFNTAFTPMSTEIVGYPFTITKVSGTPTITATLYASSGTRPCRSRFVFGSASAGNIVRMTTNKLGPLESDENGYQFVGWMSEYIPTGSAVWGIRDGGDADPYIVAVNYSGGLVREGSTAGSGNILFSLDPNKIYGVCFVGNKITRETRVHFINLSDEYRRAPLLRIATLSAQWPSGDLGSASATYTFGATAPEASAVVAGRTAGLMVGDSYGTAYIIRGTATMGVTGGNGNVITVGDTVTETATGATGTVVSATLPGGTAYTSGSTLWSALATVTVTVTGGMFQGGGALTSTGGAAGSCTSTSLVLNNTLAMTRNNVGQHVAHGQECHLIANAWRPGKPVNTSIPDCNYHWTIGRSGLRIEDMGSTLDQLGSLKGGWSVFAPCFTYNSLNGISATTRETMLTAWGIQARKLRDNVLNGNNTLIWPSQPIKIAATNSFPAIGAEYFVSKSWNELVSPGLSPSAKGRFWTYNMYPDSWACFVGDAADVHVVGDTDGARFFVSRLFGNPSGGLSTGALKNSN